MKSCFRTLVKRIIIIIPSILMVGCVVVGHVDDQNWEGHESAIWNQKGKIVKRPESFPNEIYISSRWEPTVEWHSFIPLWARVNHAPPYKVGITAFTPNGGWNELELYEISLKQNDREIFLLEKKVPIISPFTSQQNKYSTRWAKCLVDIGDWPIQDHSQPIEMHIKYKARNAEKEIQGEFSVQLVYEHINKFRWFWIGGQYD